MSLKGELKSMPITDLFQWIEINKKTGVLALAKKSVEKCFCFRDGRIIFVSSKKKGERLGEFLEKNGQIDEEKLKEALFESKEKKVPFTQYLIDNKIAPKEFLVVSVGQLAEIIFTDALNWGDGKFEFIDGLPDIVSKGPVFLSTSFLVFESVRKRNEILRGKIIENSDG
jgi:hypothetical protein